MIKFYPLALVVKMITIFPVTVVAVTFFQAVLIISSVPGCTSNCTINNVKILSDLLDERIDATVAARVSEHTAAIVNNRFDVTTDERIAATTTTVIRELNAMLDARTFSRINSTVSVLNSRLPLIVNHPVMEMLYIALSAENPRTVSLKSINTASQEVGGIISTLTIPNTSNEYTSSNNVLAYRPNHSSHSGGGMAIVFVNLEAVIPCYQVNPIGPACHLFTLNKGGFQYGKPFVQAADTGSTFRVFSQQHSIATYGFGVMGCTMFDPACVSEFELNLVCLLPPALEQCG